MRQYKHRMFNQLVLCHQSQIICSVYGVVNYKNILIEPARPF